MLQIKMDYVAACGTIRRETMKGTHGPTQPVGAVLHSITRETHSTLGYMSSEEFEAQYKSKEADWEQRVHFELRRSNYC